MNTADNHKNNKIWIWSFSLFAILLSAIALTLKIKNWGPTTGTNRVILSKVSFTAKTGEEFLVLKIKDRKSINIEIFQVNTLTQEQTFKQKFEFTNDSDAYITINKNSTNLALTDTNNDEQKDIVSPSVDQNGNLRLNSFSYNTDLKLFETIEPIK